jgi:predicted DNA-binding transcriptional regulator AlpA
MADIPSNDGVIDMSDIPSDIEPSEPERGEWVDLPTASLRLGISERSIYRRITRGTLTRRTGIHGRVEVWLPASIPVSDIVSDTSLTRPTLYERWHSEQEMHTAYMEAIARLAEENGRLKADLARFRQEHPHIPPRRRPSVLQWLRRFFCGESNTFVFSQYRVGIL